MRALGIGVVCGVLLLVAPIGLFVFALLSLMQSRPEQPQVILIAEYQPESDLARIIDASENVVRF